MSALNWQKSSYSSESVNCLYVAAVSDGTVKIRESDDPGVVITTLPSKLRTLLDGVKAGEFDHLMA
ncbi:DUF397 domain-containing protein [Kitasatospora sp. NPDC056783]|uniref:DUF397 domain-containing protein n=1 Tax=Kitasatospora sp. NPDC056783 TaxID=3345943 RepID=UPI00367E35B0